MTKRCKRLVTGCRVRVREDEEGRDLGGAAGSVTRMCTDGSAWVQLDERHPSDAVHPFEKGSDRERLVRVLPGGCELAEDRAAGNRKVRRANAQQAREPEPVLALFGKDHWSTFGYLVCIQIDGVPDRRKMRCNRGRHPLLAHAGDHAEFGLGLKEYPTRLKGGQELHNHDDWDCVADLEREGLVVNVGSAVNPVIQLTHRGRLVAGELAEHKQAGGQFANFTPRFAAAPEVAVGG